MLLNLSDLSDESLQSQIVRQIRAKILSDELAPGTSLPSIRVLARESQVSVITVQRAYELLEREGLIHSRRGKGFFISEIDQQRKNEIAEQRFRVSVAPLIRTALHEGLNKQALKEIFEDSLKSIDAES